MRPRRLQTALGSINDTTYRYYDFRPGLGGYGEKCGLASLRFSTDRLSKAAQEALNYLAWFSGGVFESFFLEFSQIDGLTWSDVRDELCATALVSVKNDISIGDRPYLRFHPTLPYAGRADSVPDKDLSEQRFIALYLNVMRLADEAIRGDSPAVGMALMSWEEANLRRAILQAFARGNRKVGWSMADPLRNYLERCARLHERDALVNWLRSRIGADQELDGVSCATTQEEAWSLLTQGRADQAVHMVQKLIQRLRTEGLAGQEDPAIQLALSQLYLGRIYYSAGAPAQAIDPLQEATKTFTELGDDHRNRLSAALGDLANAYRHLGQLDAALQAAERGLAVDRKLDRKREIATGLGRIAAILRDLHRNAEAKDRYTEALAIAEDAGDLELQGTIFQHIGALHGRTGNHDRAVELYKQAMDLFQRSEDTRGRMQTCDLIATAECQRGQLDAAEAWYERSRELAQELGDRDQMAVIAQNLGILFESRAEDAKDSVQRNGFLQQAVEFIHESLAINLEMKNQLGAASSYHQFGILYYQLGGLEEAETNAIKAMEIRESLGLPKVYMDYSSLTEIAQAKGDKQGAAQWQAKRDAKLRELEKLDQPQDDDEGKGRMEELTKFIMALAQATHQARQSGSPLDPQAAEALAQLNDLPAPLNSIGPFLKTIAQGKAKDKEIPPVPLGLPGPIAEILDSLVEALRQ